MKKLRRGLRLTTPHYGKVTTVKPHWKEGWVVRLADGTEVVLPAAHLRECPHTTREDSTVQYYVSTYCNFSHRVQDGKPVEHECRIIPPAALAAEMRGDYQLAGEILSDVKPRYMRRGVKAPAGFYDL